MLKRIKAAIVGVIAASLLFSGCVSDFPESNKSDISYGSLSFNGGESRGIDVTSLKSAVINVYGSDFTKEITKTVELTNGSVSGVTVEGIPAGSNRIVKVQAYSEKSPSDSSLLEGITLYARTDIKANTKNSVTVNKESSKKAVVYYGLLEDKVNLTDLTAADFAEIDSHIPDVHANLIDVKKFCNDYKTTLGTADSYVLSCGKLRIIGSNIENHSYIARVNDITTSDSAVTGFSEVDVLPGTWIFSVLENGELKGSENIIVKSGKVTTVYVTGESAGTVDTSKITVHVPASNGKNRIYSWTGSGAAASNLTGVWPGTVMTDSDGDGYYDYSFGTDISSCNIIFNDGQSDSGTVGTHQTKDLVSPAKGEWKYVGGAAGTGTLSDWAEWGPAPVEFAINVQNPVAAKVSVTDSSTFATTKTVTVEAVSCTISKYTIDGSNPKTSATATEFVNSETFTIGSDAAVGDIITVKVYGADEEDEVTASASFEKVALPPQPETPDRLGAYYRYTDTQFTIWSPDSTNVKVAVKKAGESAFTEYTCTKGYKVDGNYPDTSNIYGVKVDGDCRLAEYQFYIGGKAVRDPYGKMIKYEDQDAKTNLLQNHEPIDNCKITSYAGSSINIVMDIDSITTTDGTWSARPELKSKAQSVVYEVHVGDFSTHSSWNGTSTYRGKFKGLTESGTTYTKGTTTVKTGFDHLVELGITHVQIMPMFDYSSKVNETVGEMYNWGYDPVNFNVPEDRYSLNPSDYEERIREVKDMVDKLHENGIRVIMDVVYNHTFDKEMFNNISSKYYTTEDRSGCGNSVDVSNAMVSRMVRDSLEYWLDTFNIDGFRFDLMGIYTKDAMYDWGTYLNNKFSDRSLLLYGEPYQAAYHESHQNHVYADLVPSLEGAGIGAFAIQYREAIKGGNDDATKNYIFNATEKDGDRVLSRMLAGLTGSHGSSSDQWTNLFTVKPYQAVNYISAHDNLCLYDKIEKCGVTSDPYKRAIVKFGHGIVSLSQGIAFIHGGDDFLRTKSGDKWSNFVWNTKDNKIAMENSYMFGQGMNSIDWSRKATYITDFNFTKDLISFRKAHDGFTNNSGSSRNDGMVIYYSVRDSDGTNLTCVLNPGSDIQYSGSGTQIFNKSGNVNTSDKKCEGTGVTVFKN